MNLFEAWIERKEPLSFSFSGWRREWKTWANGKHVFVSPFDKNVAFDEIFRSSETVAARRQRRRGTPFKSNKIFFQSLSLFPLVRIFFQLIRWMIHFPPFPSLSAVVNIIFHSLSPHPHHSTQKHNFFNAKFAYTDIYEKEYVLRIGYENLIRFKQFSNFPYLRMNTVQRHIYRHICYVVVRIYSFSTFLIPGSSLSEWSSYTHAAEMCLIWIFSL